MNEKALRAGCALRREEVCCKQHRPGAKESQVLLFTRQCHLVSVVYLKWLDFQLGV